MNNIGLGDGTIFATSSNGEMVRIGDIESVEFTPEMMDETITGTFEATELMKHLKESFVTLGWHARFKVAKLFPKQKKYSMKRRHKYAYRTN